MEFYFKLISMICFFHDYVIIFKFSIKNTFLYIYIFYYLYFLKIFFIRNVIKVNSFIDKIDHKIKKKFVRYISFVKNYGL